MSNIERYENLRQIVIQQELTFEELAKVHNAVNFKREAEFALSALRSNDYLATCAMASQDSLKRAVINVAAIGLSLNPELKLAYLLPRKKAVCLAVSYLGYIHLAVEAGGILWAQAEVVCENDTYDFIGIGHEPVHRFDPFSTQRGKIRGAYCIAKTPTNEFIVTQMSIAEIYEIRNRSESWKAGGISPWKTDEAEMIKKTVIRRAYKSWPIVQAKSLRLTTAIDVTNEADPIDVSAPPQIADSFQRDEKFKHIRSMLDELGRDEKSYLEYLQRIMRREIKSLDSLTDIEISQCVVFLNQKMDAKLSKDV